MATISDHDLIRNSIALCAVTFDTKDWSLLKQCFTEDCIVDYPEPLKLTRGLGETTEMLQKAIGHLQTQHALTTQIIELTSEDTATAMTYNRCIHFIDDKHFFVEGRYIDKLVKSEANGKSEWKISERKVVIMGVPRGDWSVFN